MTEPEYRQDDIERGYCPTCGRPLTAVSDTGHGFCDEHSWTYGDWNGTLAARRREALGVDDDALTVLGTCVHGVDLDRAFCPEGCRV